MLFRFSWWQIDRPNKRARASACKLVLISKYSENAKITEPELSRRIPPPEAGPGLPLELPSVFSFRPSAGNIQEILIGLQMELGSPSKTKVSSCQERALTSKCSKEDLIIINKSFQISEII